MSDTKISGAAVEAAHVAAQSANEGLVITQDQVRAALEAALPHLHPQPAELAEQQGVRELFEAWARWYAASVERNDQGDYASISTNMLWNAWQAALAATGKQQVGEVQGDVVTEEMDDIHQIAFEIGGDDEGGYQFTAEELEQFVRALAARQPGELIAQKVGDYRVTVAEDTITVSHGRDIVFAYSAGDDEPIMARQPVAQPFGWLIAWNGQQPIFMTDKVSVDVHREYANCTVQEVYAAPPAQGIDLGQLPRVIELMQGVSRTLVDWAYDDQREAINIVKALIDQRDAAPGVNRG